MKQKDVKQTIINIFQKAYIKRNYCTYEDMEEIKQELIKNSITLESISEIKSKENKKDTVLKPYKFCATKLESMATMILIRENNLTIKLHPKMQANCELFEKKIDDNMAYIYFSPSDADKLFSKNCITSISLIQYQWENILLDVGVDIESTVEPILKVTFPITQKKS